MSWSQTSYVGAGSLVPERRDVCSSWGREHRTAVMEYQPFPFEPLLTGSCAKRQAQTHPHSACLTQGLCKTVLQPVWVFAGKVLLHQTSQTILGSRLRFLESSGHRHGEFLERAADRAGISSEKCPSLVYGKAHLNLFTRVRRTKSQRVLGAA